MLKKLTHPEFDLRRSYVPLIIDPPASPPSSLASYPSSLLCYSCPPDYPVYLYICSPLTSLSAPAFHSFALCIHTLELQAWHFFIFGSNAQLQRKTWDSVGLEPSVQRWNYPRTYPQHRILKCKGNSDFFSEVYVLARFEEREKWKLIQLQIKLSYWASFPAPKWGTAVQPKELQEFWLKEMKMVFVRLFPNLMDQICWSLQSHQPLG